VYLLFYCLWMVCTGGEAGSSLTSLLFICVAVNFLCSCNLAKVFVGDSSALSCTPIKYCQHYMDEGNS
jgi:hypothetical protein